MSDVNDKISADASAVVQEIGKVRKSIVGLGKMNWANLAMGVQAVMGNLSLPVAVSMPWFPCRSAGKLCHPIKTPI